MRKRPIWLQFLRFSGVAGGLALVVVVALLVAGVAHDAAPHVVRSTADPENPVRIGQPVRLAARIHTPLHRFPGDPVTVALPEGLHAAGDAQVELVGGGALHWAWRVEFEVMPYRVGVLEGSRATVPVVGAINRDEGVELVCEFPGVEVVSALPEDGEGVVLAPRVSAEEEAGAPSWLELSLVVSLMILIAALATILWTRRGPKPAPTAATLLPHERAFLDLQKLEEELPIPAERFYVRLTDVIRDYISARYAIPASHQATPEFLARMVREPAFADTHRGVLREMLSAGDLIKFAKVEATQEQLRVALDRGREFVAGTVEPEPGSDTEDGHNQDPHSPQEKSETPALDSLDPTDPGDRPT